jgi:DNA primase
MLTEHTVNRLKSKFKKICVLFDNDTAGIASMQKYQDRFGFEPILLDMEKDLSDSVAVHGLIKVREKLDELIKKKYG